MNFTTCNIDVLSECPNKNIIDLRTKYGTELCRLIDSSRLKIYLETSDNVVILIDSMNVLYSREFEPVYNRTYHSDDINIIKNN